MPQIDVIKALDKIFDQTIQYLEMKEQPDEVIQRAVDDTVTEKTLASPNVPVRSLPEGLDGKVAIDAEESDFESDLQSP